VIDSADKTSAASACACGVIACPSVVPRLDHKSWQNATMN